MWTLAHLSTLLFHTLLYQSLFGCWMQFNALSIQSVNLSFTYITFNLWMEMGKWIACFWVIFFFLLLDFHFQKHKKHWQDTLLQNNCNSTSWKSKDRQFSNNLNGVQICIPQPSVERFLVVVHSLHWKSEASKLNNSSA